MVCGWFVVDGENGKQKNWKKKLINFREFPSIEREFCDVFQNLHFEFEDPFLIN